MKICLFYLALFATLNCFCQTFHTIEVAKNNEKFLPAYLGVVMINQINPWSDTFGDLTQSTSRIKEIETTVLSKVGMKPGMVIHSIDFTSGKYSSLHLSKKFKAYFFNDPSRDVLDRYWNRFGVLLDEKAGKLLENAVNYEGGASGFAYIGEGGKFKSSASETLELSNLTDKNSSNFIKNHFMKFKKVGMIDDFKILTYGGVGNYSSIVFIHQKTNVWYKIAGKVETLMGKGMKYGNWIQGVKTIVVQDEDCVSMVLIHPSSISKVNMTCI